jgi:very-short-patch-repair endonuclease
MNEDYGFLTEQKVFKELRKRGLPCQHRVQIKDYEVDILVGERICVEVDGYYHLLQEKISKDASKQKNLEDMGYVLLRITGDEAKNHRKLRQFSGYVAAAYEEQQDRGRRNKEGALTRSVPQAGLAQLKANLEKKEEIEKAAREKLKKEPAKPKKLTDAELFLQAIDDLSRRGRK